MIQHFISSHVVERLFKSTRSRRRVWIPTPHLCRSAPKTASATLGAARPTTLCCVPVQRCPFSSNSRRDAKEMMRYPAWQSEDTDGYPAKECCEKSKVSEKETRRQSDELDTSRVGWSATVEHGASDESVRVHLAGDSLIIVSGTQRQTI